MQQDAENPLHTEAQCCEAVVMVFPRYLLFVFHVKWLPEKVVAFLQTPRTELWDSVYKCFIYSGKVTFHTTAGLSLQLER
jgi:hypothetical protein